MIVIPGFTPSDRVPDIVAINQFGAGRQSVGQVPLACVLFGNKGSAGDANLNQRYLITTEEEADARFDPRSELARMLHAGLDIPGVTLYGVAVEEAAGTAATLPIDIGGTWTTAGEIALQLDEEVIRIPVAASHTPTTFGDALEDAIDGAQNGRIFCTATNTAGRVVLTVYTLGIRGNLHVAFLDTSLAPAGMTISIDQSSDVVRTGTGPANGVTITGVPTADIDGRIEITTGGIVGTAQFSWYTDGGTTPVATGVVTAASVVLGATGLTVNFAAGTYVLNDTYDWNSYAALSNGGVPFYGGTGTDDIEAALDATDTVTNDYVAPAHNDAANVAKVETHINAKAAFDVGRLENYVVVTNRTLSGAIAIGQTTMNDALGGKFWAQDHPEHPSRTAARLAALFSVTEGAQPNTNYDGVVVPGAAPHFKDSDVPNRTTLNSALNNSVSPLITEDGDLKIVRAITSRSLNGVTPDYRCYDRPEAIVPIRVRKELVQRGKELRVENPYIGPDVAVGLPPEGTLTPRLWTSEAMTLFRQWASPQFNWLTDVEENPVQSEYDPVAKRIMSLAPPVVKPLFHQLGVIVRQTAA